MLTLHLLNVIFLCFQMGYLRKQTDGSLVYTVVNQSDPEAEGLLLYSSMIYCT